MRCDATPAASGIRSEATRIITRKAAHAFASRVSQELKLETLLVKRSDLRSPGMAPELLDEDGYGGPESTPARGLGRAHRPEMAQPFDLKRGRQYTGREIGLAALQPRELPQL